MVFAVGGAPAELDFWEKLSREFEIKSGIPVRILRYPSNTDQQRQNLVISLKAKITDPDVFLMDIAWLGLFRTAGWLMPMKEMDTTPFFPEVIDSVDRYEQQLIALPVYLDAGVLYYRKDLLSAENGGEPPRSWTELVDTARKIQTVQREINSAFHGFVWTGAQYEGLITVFMEFAGKPGGFIQEKNRLRLNSPPNVQALTLMRDLIHRTGISPPNTYTNMREEDVRLFFQRGDALFERNWPYAWALHQKKGALVRGKTGVTAIPGPGPGLGVSTLGGYHVALSRYTDKEKEALAFVKFITSFENQKRMVTELGWNPGRRDLYDDPDVLREAPHFKALKEVFRNARPRPLEPYYNQASMVAQRHINRVLAGLSEPGPALEAIDRENLDLLNRYDITTD